jgi:hypothetical protein
MKQIILLFLLGLFACSSIGQTTTFAYGSGNYYYNSGVNYKRNHVKQYTEKKYDKRKQAYYISSTHELIPKEGNWKPDSIIEKERKPGE